MASYKCVITDYMGDDASLEEKTLSEAGFDVFTAPSPRPEHWIEHALQADAILTRHAPISGDTIAGLQRCKVISRYGTGHDNIDVNAASNRSIVVTNVPGYCTNEVADHALMLILMTARHADRLIESVRTGGWTPAPLPPIRRLDGLRLGLIGLGRIGTAVAGRAVSFGMRVSAFDPYAPSLDDAIQIKGSVDEIMTDSDVVSLHLPLTSVTRHLIDERRLSLMPEGAILLNVSRGGLLDLDAAIRQVQSGHLGGLALDVTEVEPVPVDHPARNTPGVILTPHVGYYSTTSVLEAKERSVAEIVRVVNGEPAEFPVVA